MTYIN
jgi:DNA repair protein RadC